MVSGVAQSQDTPLRLIEGADNMRLDGKSGKWLIVGNVRFVKDDTKMFCDSAVYSTKERMVWAYGNVHINKEDTLNLFCDSLYFEIETEFAKLWGNVRVRDNEYKLVTDSLDFYGKENKGVYRRNGEITSITSNEKLTSKVGYFFTEAKNFFFRGDVVYTNDEYKITTDTLKFNGRSKKAFFFGPTNIYGPDGFMYCEKGWYYTDGDEGVLQKNAYIDREKEYIAGDSLYYNKNEGLSIGKGNVVIRDTANQIEFSGDFARSSENDFFAFITGHALAKRYEDEEDTLYIHADTLYNYLDSLNDPKLMLGYHNVKLFKSDMQGVCDSLSYDRVKGDMNLYIEPVLWAKKAQLSGDTITVYENGGDIRRAFLRMNALIITEVDSAKYYNQIGGRTLNAYFDSSEIRRIDIEGNAKTVMFLEDEDEQDSVILVERSGMNRIYASNLSFYLKGGEIKSVTYRESPDGKMYPMNKIKKDEERVDGFKWDNSRRPLSWETMIMTPNEFAEWEIQQQLLKDLRKLKPISKVAPPTMKNIIWAKNRVQEYTAENLDTIQKLTAENQDSIALVDEHEVLVQKVEKLRTFTKAAVAEIDSVLKELIIALDVEHILKIDSLGFNYVDFDRYNWDTISAKQKQLEAFLLDTKADTIISKGSFLINNQKEFKDSVLTLLSPFKDVHAQAQQVREKKEALRALLQPQGATNDSILEDALERAPEDSLTIITEEVQKDTLRSVETNLVNADSIKALIDSLPSIKLSSEQHLAKNIASFLVLPEQIEVMTSDSLWIKVGIDTALFSNKELVIVLRILETWKLEVFNVERKLLLYIYKALIKPKPESETEVAEKDEPKEEKTTEGQ